MLTTGVTVHGVGVWVEVGVWVAVGVLLGVGVLVGVEVGPGVGVLVGVALGPAVGRSVGVALGVRVGVRVGLGVEVGVPELPIVADGTAVVGGGGVAVGSPGFGVTVGTGLFRLSTTSVARAPASSASGSRSLMANSMMRMLRLCSRPPIGSWA
jgi:hypothetical protein